MPLFGNGNCIALRLEVAGRRALAVGLLFFATLKFISPYNERYALSIEGYYAAAMAEACLGALLLRGKFVTVASLLTALLCWASIAITVMADGDCGCGGSFFSIESRPFRFVLAAAGGVVSSCVMQYHLNRKASISP